VKPLQHHCSVTFHVQTLRGLLSSLARIDPLKRLKPLFPYVESRVITIKGGNYKQARIGARGEIKETDATDASDATGKKLHVHTPAGCSR
jgi:hypothetical protein